jgi:hypothetical protein
LIPTVASRQGGLRLAAEEVAIETIENVTGLPVGAVLRNPFTIRFSHDSIRARFKNPEFGAIDDLAEGLRTGRIRPQDVEPIRLVEREANDLDRQPTARGISARWR